MKKFLEHSQFIDWQHPSVMSLAVSVGMNTDSGQPHSPLDIVQNGFKFVRDEIRHSSDFGLNMVTVKASDVLRHESGLCYGKSHLLAALLRANGVPSALCYQRLSIGRDLFCLHSLNAVWLDGMGWCRLDARGNNRHVHTEFSPPNEQLAFKPSSVGERDSLTLYSRPLKVVTEHLSMSSCISELDLPDLAEI